MGDLLARLNEVNDVEVVSVFSEEFRSYGRVVEGYDVSELITYMKEHTDIPEDGNVYVPSVEGMELTQVCTHLQDVVYAGMPIQVGYCNGRNSTYNGFEYHKGSELNIAVGDMMLVLGHSYDIKDNHYDNADAQVFLVPAGTMIEMYQTTLHLSPIKVCDEGFKAVVVLPKGTNTPLSAEEKASREEAKELGDLEATLLLQRNKWVVAHPERKPLIDQGAFPGIIGENKELFY